MDNVGYASLYSFFVAHGVVHLCAARLVSTMEDKRKLGRVVISQPRDAVYLFGAFGAARASVVGVVDSHHSNLLDIVGIASSVSRFSSVK